MAVRRRMFATPGYSVSTKGHSVLRSRSYAMPTRTPISTGISRAASSVYDTRVEDYLLTDRVSHAGYISNAALIEGYDTAKRSRGRDEQLLREATNAIPSPTHRETMSSTTPSPRAASLASSRLGKSRALKKAKHVSYDPDPISLPSNSRSTADLMASPAPVPYNVNRRFARRLPIRDSMLDDEPAWTTALRARGIRNSPFSPPSKVKTDYLPSIPLHLNLPSPSPSRISESRLLSNYASKGPLPTRPALPAPQNISYDTPVHPGYDPMYVEYEPETKPLPRRRQKVLGTSRRPAGNYYDRLLRKRGKRRGRLGPYYDVESIAGSDLTDVLSDVESQPDLKGTYDDFETSSSPSYYEDYSTPDPSSPYYVDLDTEYVPFKPSRSRETNGLLELSAYDDTDDYSDGEEEKDNSLHTYTRLPSPTLDLSLSSFEPTTSLAAKLSSSHLLPYRSVVPSTFPSFDDSTTVIVPSDNQALLDSLVTTSVERARSALKELAMPNYHGVSLVLSVEGAGRGPDGKRMDFTYTPPPIPLYGRSLGLDDRIMGLKPSTLNALKPVDSFLAGYMQRMGVLRAEINERMNKDQERRKQHGWRTPIEAAPRKIIPYTPSHEYVPVRHLTSRHVESVPVTSYRRTLEDGRSHRLDVFPLTVTQSRLPAAAQRAITLPSTRADSNSPFTLSVLDKIKIKVSSESYATPQTSVVSRRLARGRSLPPRSASVPPRPAPVARVEVDSSPSKVTTITSTSATYSSTQADTPAKHHYNRPIILFATPPRRLETRAKSVPPFMLSQEEKTPSKTGWRALTERVAKASYSEGRPRRSRHMARALAYLNQEEIPKAPLPTAHLRAHKIPRRFLTRSGIRTPFSSLYGYYEHSVRSKRAPRSLSPRRQTVEERRAGIRREVSWSRRATSPPARERVGYRARSAPPKFKPLTAREALSDFPKVYVPTKGPKPSNRAKAAIIGSKLEPDPVKRSRRPRSQFAADKLRAMRKEAQESVYTSGAATTAMSASTPPLPKLTERKAIRTEDGYTKPKNILSWQYRVESLLSPNDLLYQPSSFIRIREQVRDAQDRMDRHRQLLDRYLPDNTTDTSDVASGVLRKMAELEKRDPVSYRIGGGAESRRTTVTIPDYYATGVDPRNPPVSDLRRRIRRTLNKTRNSTGF